MIMFFPEHKNYFKLENGILYFTPALDVEWDDVEEEGNEWAEVREALKMEEIMYN